MECYNGFLVWPSKPSRLRFVSCATKPTGGFGTGHTSRFGTGHASKSGSLLRLKACRARVSQSGLKTGDGTMMGGARGIITQVAPSGSRRRTGRCDRLHRTLLPQLYHFLCIRP
jgi:hypothetical protein